MTTRFYWWIVSSDPTTHRPYLIFGSDKSESDAIQRGRELLNGLDFTVRKLRTRNLARASSFLKGNRLEQTHSLTKAGQRLGHTKTVQRDRKRRTHKRDDQMAPLW